MTHILGIGVTRFGSQPDRTIVALGCQAASLALADAGLAAKDMQSVFFANVLGPVLFGDMTLGQDVCGALGLAGVPVVNVENACTSGSTAFYLAMLAIEAGACDIVLVVGAEKMCVPSLGLVGGGQSDYASKHGMAAPVGFAMRAARHIYEFGTTPAQLAAVTVKSRAFAAHNPLAQFSKPETIDSVLAAPMIVDPLTRPQCCPIADGASAVVLVSDRIAKKYPSRAIKVDAAVLTSGRSVPQPDIVRWATDAEAGAMAYEKAGIGAEDVNVVECHDAFTISEILHYEALGLCQAGAGGALVESGATALGGRVPVNPSGGLLSRGHPIAATGLAQISEIVAQLRGEAGGRQVSNARVGVAHCMGGDKDADTKSCTVVVMST